MGDFNIPTYLGSMGSQALRQHHPAAALRRGGVGMELLGIWGRDGLGESDALAMESHCF